MYLHFVAWALIGHLHAAFIPLCVSRLSGFTITRTQPCYKSPCLEQMDRRGSTEFPCCTAQKKDVPSFVHPWQEIPGSKEVSPFQEGQSALDSLQRLRRRLGRSISLWDLASPWANGAWLTSFLSKWFSRQWQGELDLCNKRQGELDFYSSAVWRRICLTEKGGSEENSERAAVNEQKLTARSRLQHGPGDPGTCLASWEYTPFSAPSPLV